MSKNIKVYYDMLAAVLRKSEKEVHAYGHVIYNLVIWHEVEIYFPSEISIKKWILALFYK